jgi:hypothetical protein
MPIRPPLTQTTAAVPAMARTVEGSRRTMTGPAPCHRPCDRPDRLSERGSDGPGRSPPGDDSEVGQGRPGDNRVLGIASVLPSGWIGQGHYTRITRASVERRCDGV